MYIKYSNITPGNYELQLFNIEGQSLTKISVILNNQSGEVLIPVRNLPVSVLIYCFSNQHLTFNGKVLIN